MNLDQRFYLRDELHHRSANPPPDYDDEREPAGCLALVIPFALLFWSVVGWLVYANLKH